MKLKKLFLMSSTILPLTIAAVSCGAPTKTTTSTPGADNGSNTGGGKTNMTDTAKVAADLKKAAADVKFDYKNKVDVFPDVATKPESRNNFNITNLDSKYKVDFVSVVELPETNSIEVKYKVSLNNGATSSDEVTTMIEGFKAQPITYQLSKKDAILAELKKDTSRIYINLQNNDVVIPASNDAVDFTKANSFIVVGKFNEKFIDNIEKTFKAKKMEVETKVRDFASKIGSTGKAAAGSFSKLMEMFNFDLIKDIWNKKPGSLDKILNVAGLEAVLKEGVTRKLIPEKIRKFLPLIPKDVKFKDEVLALWNKEKQSLGFKENTIFIPTGEATIDFSKPTTFKAVLTLPKLSSDEKEAPDFSGLLNSSNFDVVSKSGSTSNEKLKEILSAIAEKVKQGGFVFERDGIKSVGFSYSKLKTT